MGFIYVIKEKMMQEYQGKPEKEAMELARDRLRAEVNTYDNYLTGKVYYFMLTDKTTGEMIDSCGGILADDLADLKEELKGLVSEDYADVVNELDYTY